MRILLDYRPALRQRTGVGHFVHELAVAMAAQLRPGESLVLFSSSWKDRLRGDAVPGAQIVDHRLPVRLLNFAWHRLEHPRVEWLAGAVDVAQSAHPLLIPARRRAVRAVIVYDLDFLDHPDRTRAEIRRDYPVLARAHARRADLVVVISEHTAAQVRERFEVPPERLVLCRPGVPAQYGETDRVEDGRPPGPILFVGTIEPRKNLPTLFAAYEQLITTRQNVPPLVLAGRSVEQSAGILAALGRPPLVERVSYRGYVSDDERQALYREASMLVLPSFEEGFGMPAVEAMHAGLPVVASARGALPEVVGAAGILIDPADAGAFAAAMGRLLEDPVERRRRVDAGRVRARLFSWQESGATLLAAYREAVARRKRTP